MIGITFADGLIIYLLTWFALLIFLRVRSLLRRRRNQWELNSNSLFTCDNCHFAFLEKEPVNLTRCPRCNAMCIRRQVRRKVQR